MGESTVVVVDVAAQSTVEAHSNLPHQVTFHTWHSPHSVRCHVDVNVKAQVIRVLNTYRFAQVSKIRVISMKCNYCETEGVAAKENVFLESSRTGTSAAITKSCTHTLSRLLRLNRVFQRCRKQTVLCKTEGQLHSHRDDMAPRIFRTHHQFTVSIK